MYHCKVHLTHVAEMVCKRLYVSISPIIMRKRRNLFKNARERLLSNGFGLHECYALFTSRSYFWEKQTILLLYCTCQKIADSPPPLELFPPVDYVRAPMNGHPFQSVPLNIPAAPTFHLSCGLVQVLCGLKCFPWVLNEHNQCTNLYLNIHFHSEKNIPFAVCKFFAFVNHVFDLVSLCKSFSVAWSF